MLEVLEVPGSVSGTVRALSVVLRLLKIVSSRSCNCCVNADTTFTFWCNWSDYIMIPSVSNNSSLRRNIRLTSQSTACNLLLIGLGGRADASTRRWRLSCTNWREVAAALASLSPRSTSHAQFDTLSRPLPFAFLSLEARLLVVATLSRALNSCTSSAHAPSSSFALPHTRQPKRHKEKR